MALQEEKEEMLEAEKRAEEQEDEADQRELDEELAEAEKEAGAKSKPGRTVQVSPALVASATKAEKAWDSNTGRHTTLSAPAAT